MKSALAEVAVAETTLVAWSYQRWLHDALKANRYIETLPFPAIQQVGVIKRRFKTIACLGCLSQGMLQRIILILA
jgi:hypothetical protein